MSNATKNFTIEVRPPSDLSTLQPGSRIVLDGKVVGFVGEQTSLGFTTIHLKTEAVTKLFGQRHREKKENNTHGILKNS